MEIHPHPKKRSKALWLEAIPISASACCHPAAHAVVSLEQGPSWEGNHRVAPNGANTGGESG